MNRGLREPSQPQEATTDEPRYSNQSLYHLELTSAKKIYSGDRPVQNKMAQVQPNRTQTRLIKLVVAQQWQMDDHKPHVKEKHQNSMISNKQMNQVYQRSQKTRKQEKKINLQKKFEVMNIKLKITLERYSMMVRL